MSVGLEERDLYDLIENYSLATNVGCKLFDSEGRMLTETSVGDESSFCELIHQCEEGERNCKRSYLDGGLQAEKLGEAYIYSCPYGLVNWAVPILENNKMKYFLTGGPVLIYQVNDLLLKNLVEENQFLEAKIDEIETKLKELNNVDTVRVRHLAEMLMRLAKGLMVNDTAELRKRRELNEINAKIAETVHSLKQDNAGNEILYPFEKENELISKVKLGDKEGAREILNEILGFIYFQTGSKFEMVKSKAIELMVILARASIEIGADLEVIFGLEYIYLENINQVEDINELSGSLAKVLDRFIEATFVLKNVKNKDIIRRAMRYIRDNYDQDINLDQVSSEVGLSAAYFSKLFKEELEITYTDYLNRVRIEEGKKLLEKEYSLADVAQMSGFNDQSYFSKVFKKFEGVSPGRWRCGVSKRRIGG
ncbi:PocR ligand-binding domain-containing protein [Natroniella sulfidigena]|uniref:PocR ligand-binding domain-containing protein n=1 Tax=Natroniella sulfidigena TaxID=723921 RepID=UPI00200B81AC|nr:PocR ligand-binding domain-containing protein [Natroniella sulfidigena]MCK8817846.1 PocR ligand-binding domain-containing protein [Natroniella sulfidigena]